MKKLLLALFVVLGLSAAAFTNEFNFDNSDTPLHDYIFIKNESDVKIGCTLQGENLSGESVKVANFIIYDNQEIVVGSTYSDKFDSLKSLTFIFDTEVSGIDAKVDHNDMHMVITAAAASDNHNSDSRKVEKVKGATEITYSHKIDNADYDKIKNKIKENLGSKFSIKKDDGGSKTLEGSMMLMVAGVGQGFNGLVQISENEVTLKCYKIRQGALKVEPKQYILERMSLIDNSILEAALE